MAQVTVSPGRRLSQAPAARSYSNLASRYAQAFQAAIDQAEQNDLATKLSEFKLGNYSYGDFKKYLQGKIDAYPDGSKKRADYTSLMVDATNFNKTNIENQAKDTVSKLRTQLLEKFPGQVTPKDQLAIVRELKSKVDPSTDAYASLVSEETNLKNSIIQTSTAAGKTNLLSKLEQAYAILQIDNKQAAEDFQNGKIDGYQMDSRLNKNYQDLTGIVKEVTAAGVTVPDKFYTSEVEGQYLQNRLAGREVGQVFDVLNQKSGKYETVTQDVLNSDRLSSSPNYMATGYSVGKDDTGSYVILDEAGKILPTTGYYATPTEAQTAIKKLGDEGGWSVIVPFKDKNGTSDSLKYNFDIKTGLYTPSPRPDQASSPADIKSFTDTKTFSPVGNSNVLRFVPTADNQTLSDFINAGTVRLKNSVNPDGSLNLSGLQAGLANDQNLPPGVSGPVRQSTIMPAQVKPGQPLVQPNTPLSAGTNNPFGINENLVTPTIKPRSSIVPPFVQPTKTAPQSFAPPASTQMSSPGFSSLTPSVSGPVASFPSSSVDFLNKSSFNAPSLPGINSSIPFTTSSGPMTGPSVSSGGFLNSLKTFGANALASVKNFLGF